MIGRADPAFEPVVDLLERIVALQTYAIGVQLYLAVGHAVVVNAGWGTDSIGQPIGPESIHRVYCAGKPVTAVALARAVTDAGLDVNVTIGEVLDSCSPAASQVRMSDLLTHRAGLQESIFLASLPIEERERQAREAAPVTGFRVGEDSLYSSYLNWHILGRCIETLSRQPLDAYIEANVLAPMRVTAPLLIGGMSAGELTRWSADLRANAVLNRSGPLPLEMELDADACTAWNPGHGNYACMRGLGEFYRHLLRRLDGSTAGEVLAGFTRSQRHLVWDPILGHPCSFGYGFMTELSSHGLGPRCSASSFGHSGLEGMVIGFADPDHDLVVALLFNGIINKTVSITRRRLAVVHALYRCLEQYEPYRHGGQDDG